MPVLGNTQGADAAPAALSPAEAHTTLGAGSVALVEAYTTIVAAVASAPVAVIVTVVGAVMYTVPDVVYVNAVGPLTS